MSGVQPHSRRANLIPRRRGVGVHLSSDQMTYDLMMDADLYNSF